MLSNSPVYIPSGEHLLDLFDVNGFEISLHPCPIHYFHVGNGGVLNKEVHQNVHIVDLVRFRELSDPTENSKFENDFKALSVT